MPQQATVVNPQTGQRKVVNVGDPNAFAGGFQLETKKAAAPAPSPAPASPATTNQATNGGQFGSNAAFGAAFGALMKYGQQNQTLQDAKNKLLVQLYDRQLTPDEINSLPPSYQDAVRNNDKSLIEQQILGINDQIKGRADQNTAAMDYMMQGYVQDQKDAQMKKDVALKNFTAMLTKYPDIASAMSPAGFAAIQNGDMPGPADLQAAYGAYRTSVAADALAAKTAAAVQSKGGVLTVDQVANLAAKQTDPAMADKVWQTLTPYIGKTAQEAGNAIQKALSSSSVPPTVTSSDNVTIPTSQLGSNPYSPGTEEYNLWQKQFGGTASAVASAPDFGSVAKPSSSSTTVPGGTLPTQYDSFPPNPDSANVVDDRYGRTPETLYQQAMEYALKGGNLQQFVGGLSSKDPRTQAIKDYIANKAGAIAASLGSTFPQLQELYKSNSAAATQNVERLARVDSVSNAMTLNFPRLEQLAQSVSDSGVNVTESDIQSTQAQIERKFGNTDAAAYIELIQTMRSDYASAQAALAGSTGGQFFAESAKDAIPVGLSPDQYGSIMETIVKSSQNAKDAIGQTVSGLLDVNPSNLGSSGSSQTMSDADAYKLFLQQTGQSQ